jgi:hypothetical protein
MAKTLQELLIALQRVKLVFNKWRMNYCWKLSFTLFVKS